MSADVGVASSDEYSDGETSEDLAMKRPTFSNGYSPCDIFSPPSYSRNSLVSQLKQIDETISLKGKSLHLPQLTDQDFYIDQLNKPFLYVNGYVLEPTQSVVLVTGKPTLFTQNESQYTKGKPQIIGWADLNQIQATDAPVYIQNTYKEIYKQLRAQINFNYLLGPSSQKFHLIERFRRECIRGRQMFHYIGYGMPNITDLGIPVINENVKSFFSFHDLFELVYTPSCFVFDCNNAEIVIKHLEKAASGQSRAQNRHSSEKRQANDWFCFCATSEGEEVPLESFLPRDFFSICLLSPVPIAILCHILANYRTSFPSKDFPISILNDILLNGIPDEKEDLESILVSVTDSVAADNIQPFMFKQLFRRDRMISLLFEHFVIAQHLLHPYGVHPCSNPRIPSMAAHTLWNEWDCEVDTWVRRKIMGSPSSSHDFFTLSIKTFEAEMENGRISPLALSLMCHAPFSNPDDAKHAIILLSQYAAKSQENRIALSKVAIFHTFFSRLVKCTDNEEFHALCYIVISLLQSDPSSVFDIRHDLDISRLPRLLFDNSLNCQTRSLVAAILATVLDTVKAVEAFCSTPDFFRKLTKELPQASPQLQMWLLILVKRLFGTFPALPASYQSTSAHLQVAAILFHKAPEVRAAAISSLSAFIGDGNSKAFLYIAAPLVFDMSYVVRYEFSQFLSRYIEYQCPQMEHAHRGLGTSKTISSYIAALLKNNQINLSEDGAFTRLVGIADDQITKEDVHDDLVRTISQLTEVLEHDPHPSVKQMGDKLAASIFDGGDAVEGGSDSLFNVSLRQLANAGQWHTLTYEDKEVTIEQDNMSTDNFTACSLHQWMQVRLSDIIPARIEFDRDYYGITVAAPWKSVVKLDDNLNKVGKLSFTDCKITDLKTVKVNGVTIVYTASSDGCVSVWPSNHHECSSSFRASIPTFDNDINQLISPSEFYPRLAASNDNGGVTLWDMNQSQMTNEWSGVGKKMSALHTASIDDTTVVAGYDDGSLLFIDARDPLSLDFKNSSSNISRIVSIGSSFSDRYNIQTMSAKGEFSLWDMRMFKRVFGTSIGTNVDICDFHPHFPIAIASTRTSSPRIYSTTGKCLCIIPQITQVTDLAMHPKLPIFACATSSGDIFSFQIAFSYNSTTI